MRVGISITSNHPTLSPPEAVAATLARVSAAAAAGLDHLTFGDHHSVGPDRNYLQGVPMLARASALWPSDRPFGLLFLLPLWHPVMVAELVGTLAAMSDARLIVQTGIGSGEGQFAAMGAQLRTRGVVTSEAIRVIDDLLRGQEVSSPSLGIERASISPRPSQPVDWWIGSGDAPAALDRAVGLGDALYLSPSWTVAEVGRIATDYRERCAEQGRPPRVVVRRDVFISDDDAAGVKVGDELAASGYRGLRREVLVCGGVGRAIDLLSPLAARGVDDVVVRTVDVSALAAIRSIELTGKVREDAGNFGGYISP